MDSEWGFIGVLTLVVLLFFGGLIGMGYGEYKIRLKCIDSGGTYVSNVCMARPTLQPE